MGSDPPSVTLSSRTATLKICHLERLQAGEILNVVAACKFEDFSHSFEVTEIQVVANNNSPLTTKNKCLLP